MGCSTSAIEESRHKRSEQPAGAQNVGSGCQDPSPVPCADDVPLSKKASSEMSSAIVPKSGWAADPANRPSLTDDEKEIVQSSWMTLRDFADKIGVEIFLTLFKMYPETQNLFKDFNGLTVEELENYPGLLYHSRRVMLVIEDGVKLLNTPDSLVEALHELGAKHVLFGITSVHMDLIGAVIISVFKDNAGEWSDQTDRVWQSFFALVTHLMKERMPKV